MYDLTYIRRVKSHTKYNCAYYKLAASMGQSKDVEVVTLNACLFSDNILDSVGCERSHDTLLCSVTHLSYRHSAVAVSAITRIW